MTLPDGTQVLAVHAAPGRDTGLGIKVGLTEDELALVLGDCNADLIFGGHQARWLGSIHYQPPVPAKPSTVPTFFTTGSPT